MAEYERLGYPLSSEIAFVQEATDQYNTYNERIIYWIVPPGVRSISFRLSGGPAAWQDRWGGYMPSSYHFAPIFYDFPVTPGEHIVMEAGGSSLGYNILVSSYSTYRGGFGGNGGGWFGTDGYGLSAGGASWIGRRTGFGSPISLIAMAGGMGGCYTGGDQEQLEAYRDPFPPAYPDPVRGPATFGGPTSFSGAESGHDGGYRIGGSAAGWGAGAAGVTMGDPGQSGGWYLPSGTDDAGENHMGGRLSPTRDDLFIAQGLDPEPEDPETASAWGYVSLWYYTPGRTRGINVGSVRLRQ